jgi:hypothetical protein
MTFLREQFFSLFACTAEAKLDTSRQPRGLAREMNQVIELETSKQTLEGSDQNSDSKRRTQAQQTAVGVVAIGCP